MILRKLFSVARKAAAAQGCIIAASLQRTRGASAGAPRPPRFGLNSAGSICCAREELYAVQFSPLWVSLMARRGGP
jgi:hypothetical protein